jgi:hypothetical protein
MRDLPFSEEGLTGHLRSEKDVNSAQGAQCKRFQAIDFRRYLNYTSARRLCAMYGQAEERTNRLERPQRHRVCERAIVRVGKRSGDAATEGMSLIVDGIRNEMRVPATVFSDAFIPSEDGIRRRRTRVEVRNATSVCAGVCREIGFSHFLADI